METPGDTSAETPTDTTVETPTDTVADIPTDTTVRTPTDTTEETPTDTTVETPTDTVTETPTDTTVETPTDTATEPQEIPDDDRLTQPPEVDGLPPPDADEPDDTVDTASTEEYWYADEREDLLAAATDRLRDPPPPSDPTGTPQWAADAWSPDYGHLARHASDEAFRFAAADLALLCELNSFDVEFGQDEVLFGLRGCMVAGGTGGSLRAEVLLQEAVPDHHDFRCVIGVWKRSTGQLAVFTGSTVPNPTGMKRQFAFGDAERRCNLLPTGRYKYIVGNHKAVPNAFRLEQEVMVLRSHDDLMFETTDFWDRCTPGDNIHPAWASSEARFSSFGCQTVSGAHSAAKGHTGEWATFRACAGLSTSGEERRGKDYVYILLTGPRGALRPLPERQQQRQQPGGKRRHQAASFRIGFGMATPSRGSRCLSFRRPSGSAGRTAPSARPQPKRYWQGRKSCAAMQTASSHLCSPRISACSWGRRRTAMPTPTRAPAAR